MQILLIFTILTFINVVMSTVRSILTIKGNWITSSLISGFYYGFYNIVLIYTVADFPLWQKVLVTTLMNFIGVALVKRAEEKIRKARLWKVEMTVLSKYTDSMIEELEKYNIPYNYIENIGKYTLFNSYCETEKDSSFVKEIALRHNAKFFVSESKTL